MYKLLAVLAIVLFICTCGGPKKETPNKPVTTAAPVFAATIKTVDSMTVISIAKNGSYSDVGKTIGELMTWVIAKKIRMTGNPFGIYYDNPAKVTPESTRYEICLPVSKDTKSDNIIKVKQLPKMEVASTIYMGSYDKIGTAYEKLTNWITEQGYIITGPSRELYFSNPASASPESLKTEVQLPISKKTQ